MTLNEYHSKLVAYMSSDAPAEVKDKAIRELKAKFANTTSVDIAKQQLEESKPDTSDIGEDYDE